MPIVLPFRPAPLGFTTFDAQDLLGTVAGASPASLDALLFGVVGLAADGKVLSYNVTAQRLSGLAGGDVVGRDFFVEVAPCTDNLMIRERFRSAWQRAVELDEEIRFAFSYPMNYARVALRLLARGRRGWLAFRPV
jgi:photoactive yellow protein